MRDKMEILRRGGFGMRFKLQGGEIWVRIGIEYGGVV